MKELKKKSFQVKININELIAQLSQGIPVLWNALNTGDEINIAGALISFLGVFSCLNIKNTRGRLLAKFLENSLRTATLESLKIIPKEKLRVKQKVILKKQIKPISNPLIVDLKIFDKPGSSQLSKIYLENLCEILKDIDADLFDEIQKIALYWPEIFSKAASDEWFNDPEYANELTNDKISGPMQEYIEALQEESKYKHELLSMTTEKFFDDVGSIDEVFIDLNALYKSSNGCKKICNIESELISWSLSSTTGMVVVEGEPGSGKSTILKKVAKELISIGKPVIYINLYKLPFSLRNDCLSTLQEYLKKFAWYGILNIDSNEETIYILDGLDEIKYDVWDNAKNLTQQLSLSQLCDKQKVILSGRIKIIDYCAEELDKFDKFTLLPLVYEDIDSDQTIDKREELWFKLQNTFKIKITIEELTSKEHLEELSSNPLLLFLLAWTFSNSPESIDKINNSVQLYRQILKCIYERKYNRPSNNYAGSLKEYESYFRILSAIGASAWHNNSREISIQQIKKYCFDMGSMKEFENWFEDENNLQTSKLFLLFFAHESHKENTSSFVFLHKSFYEFLATEEIMYQINKIPQLDKTSGIEKMCRLLCKRNIDSDSVFYFMEDMIIDNKTTFKTYSKNLKYVFSLFEPQIIDEAFQNSSKRNPLFDEMNLVALANKTHYINRNLWNLVGYVFSTISKHPDLVVENCFSFENLQFSNHTIFANNLLLAKFIKCTFDEVTMTLARFNNGIWYDSQMFNCAFCSTSFDECEINKMHIQDTHFEAASFQNSKIIDSYFDGNRMEGAYLCEATITKTKFKDCDFTASNFDDTKFIDCEFIDCNFERADFTRLITNSTKFINCSFLNTKMNDVSLSSFDLHSDELNESLSEADLKNANWGGVSLEIKNKLTKKFH